MATVALRCKHNSVQNTPPYRVKQLINSQQQQPFLMEIWMYLQIWENVCLVVAFRNLLFSVVLMRLLKYFRIRFVVFKCCFLYFWINLVTRY